MSKETGLICTGEMVRAILDGRKTQTRRTRGLEHINKNPNRWTLGKSPQSYESNDFAFLDMADPIGTYPTLATCPYGKVGNKLWVRETHRIMQGIIRKDGHKAVSYAADFSKQELSDMKTSTKRGKYPPWKSPLFMPKWAARIWLEITGIRVEILKEISDNDIICEGFETREDFYGTIIKINQAKNPEEFLNKWVWALDFMKCQK